MVGGVLVAIAVASCSLRDVSDLTRDTNARADGDGGTGDDGGAPPTPPAGDGGCTLGPYACAVLEAGPVLYLRFDEASVSEAVKDSSGRTSTALRYPPGTTVQVPGALEAEQPNVSARFTSGGRGIAMPPGLDFTDRAPFSVELWIAPEGTDPDGDGLSIVLDHQTYTPDRAGWALVFHPQSTSISFEFWNGGQPFFIAPSGDGAVPLAVWHHLVLASDGVLATTWVDGKVATHGTVDPQSLPIVPEGWKIGSQNCGPCSNDYVGGIDELAIYARALDDGIVQRHYAAARTRP